MTPREVHDARRAMAYLAQARNQLEAATRLLSDAGLEWTADEIDTHRRSLGVVEAQTWRGLEQQ